MIYFQKFEVFNEMEMEINVINNKIFTELYLKIIVSVNIYQTKKSISIVMKACFSYAKLMKQFGPPLPPSPPLSTKPPITDQYFHDPSLSKFKKRKHHPTPLTPPTPLIIGGRKLIVNFREENSNFLKCLRLRIYTCAPKS